MVNQVRTEQKEGKTEDRLLDCLQVCAKQCGVHTDELQIRRANCMGSDRMDLPAFAAAARRLGLKARLTEYRRMPAALPFPALLLLNNGSAAVLLRRNEQQSVLYDPVSASTLAVAEEELRRQWSGRAVLVGKAKGGTALGGVGVTEMLGRHGRGFVTALLLSILLLGLSLAAPLFTQVVVNKVLVQHGMTTLHVMVAGMIAVCLYETWIDGLRSRLIQHHAGQVDAVLSTRLLKKLLALPLPFFEAQQSGDVVARLREMETVRRFLTGAAFTTIVDSLFALIYLLILCCYNMQLTWLALATLAGFLALNWLLTPLIQRGVAEKYRLNSERQTFLIEALGGIQTIKTSVAEVKWIQRWDEMTAGAVKRSFRNACIDNLGNSLAALIQQLSTVAILWFGIRLVLAQELTVGELLAFQMYAAALVAPVLRLAAMWQKMQETREALARLREIAEAAGEAQFDPNRATLAQLHGEIELERLTFRYPGSGQQALRNVSLKIRAGERIGIVGGSGSGKSTLAKLVQRLYLPESGRLLVDGMDAALLEPAWLRRQIGVVLQDCALFSGNVYENIALARPDASTSDVETAARQAGVKRFAERLPHGLRTAVGERGDSLSGGQKQRVAIARALLVEPRILIFDEATSALDPEAERLVRDELQQMARDRTMLLIAHRLATVKDCDRIIVMKRGEIVEQGTEEQLLALRGEYWAMHCSQHAETNNERRSDG